MKAIGKNLRKTKAKVEKQPESRAEEKMKKNEKLWDDALTSCMFESVNS